MGTQNHEHNNEGTVNGFISYQSELLVCSPQLRRRALLLQPQNSIEIINLLLPRSHCEIRDRKIEKIDSKAWNFRRISLLESLNRENPAKATRRKRKRTTSSQVRTRNLGLSWRKTAEKRGRNHEFQQPQAGTRELVRIGRLQKPVFYMWSVVGFVAVRSYRNQRLRD